MPSRSDSTTGDIVSILEACYRVDQTDSEWVSGILEAARPVVEVGKGVIVATLKADDSAEHGAIAFRDLPAGLESAIPDLAAQFDTAFIRRNFRTHCHIKTSDPLWLRIPIVRKGGLRHWNVRDGFAINGFDLDRTGVCIIAFGAKEMVLSDARRLLFDRVSFHLEAGHRLRRRLAMGSAPRVEAILDPNGKLHHAVGAARCVKARVALIRATKAIERARGRLRHDDSGRATAIWRGIISQRWTLVDHFESDGRRYVLARENERERMGLLSLTAREKEVLAFSALGHSSKAIAFELGIADSTVRVHLARAIGKLGAGSKEDALRSYGRAVDESKQRNAKS